MDGRRTETTEDQCPTQHRREHTFQIVNTNTLTLGHSKCNSLEAPTPAPFPTSICDHVPLVYQEVVLLNI